MNPEKLIDKYLEGSLSIRERFQLNDWVKKDLKNLNIFKDKIKSYSYVIPLHFDTDKAFEKFYNQIQLKKQKRLQRLKVISIAASFMVLIALGFLYNHFEVNKTSKHTLSSKETNESLKHIQIILPDGSQQIIDKKSTEYVKTSNGKLVASKSDDIIVFGNENKVEIDTSITQIDIPYGEKIRLKLSDGTLVWLNSGTSFRFPQNFDPNSNTRQVEVKGEAYFEVLSDQHKPFIVNTPSVNIKVLGTHFNVASYANDHSTKTTLMEGKVHVYKSFQNENALELNPNQQAVFKKTDLSLSINNVEAKNFNSWIDNVLVVDGLSFLELKEKLERRYNVIITSEIDGLWNTVYRGEFHDESLKETLQTIALSSHFEFEIDGKHVRIFNKKPTINS
ncbi:FecR family protein [Psychroflexus sp. CAK8W]|uniref:FecR family protein n=1 Tax=Psychroflexus longus TaxID=2873596 RepID=A0ABS7XIX4_9FLAO|nr:FecR family protein [Psychroflexus longus]MBZ9778051.1 FecR family protein [Psychroflexus longus]